ncbi:uncharacterized protein LOC132054911 [Lycium ferocissimum]|uniref:uncharacterized protein LOC132054911 n=1 Tax=Lycium ferocissimum TaxID=112874 RepID=UPI0028168F25|nr:uncharacterized protein LOC132054911 [Lycium ferocissimum]
MGNNTRKSVRFDQQEVVQEKEVERNKAIHVEKVHPREDNCPEEEMIVSLANNVKLVPADFTINKAENDKEGVLSTTSFGLLEVSPQKKIHNATEGDKSVHEDTHGKKDHLISQENIFSKQRKAEVLVKWDHMDDVNPFIHRGGSFSMHKSFKK